MKAQFFIQDTVETLRRRLWHLLLPVLLGLALGGAASVLVPPSYESHTTILVQPNLHRSSSLQPKQDGFPPEDGFATIQEILQSRSTLTSLLDSLGIGTSDNALQESTLAAVRSGIRVQQAGPGVFRISVQSDNPLRAWRGVSVLTNLYGASRSRLLRRYYEDIVTYCEEKLAQHRQAFEAEKRAERRGRDDSSPAAPSTGISRIALERLAQELEEIESISAQAENRKELLVHCAKNIDDSSAQGDIVSFDATIPYSGELKDLVARYSSLLARYTPLYPEAQGVRQQIVSLLEKSLAAVDEELELAEERRRQLLDRRSGMFRGAPVSSRPEGGGVAERAGREGSGAAYAELRSKLEQAKMDRDLAAANRPAVMVLDPPQVPSAPSSPGRVALLATTGGAGLLLGLLSVLLAEFLDPTIRRRRDLEVFGKPIIAYLP